MGEGRESFSKELEQKVKEHQAVLLKYPKNIRQIGEIGDGQRIYVEDYVMTYVTYLGSKAKDSYRSAILLGQKAVVEGRRTLFISGAVEIPQEWKQNLSITGEQWTAIYDQMQKYFQEIEIVGWFLTRPGMELEINDQVRTVWRSGFDGTDKVLFLYDNISREDAFYTCKEGEFQHQEGYYIYYEKNEEMQNYIIDEKGGKSTDEGYKDITSKKIRKKIEEKNKVNAKYLRHQQLAYSAGILASAVVLVTAATKLYHSASEEAMADLAGDTQAVFKDGSWILSKKEKEIAEEQEGKNEIEERKETKEAEGTNGTKETKETEQKGNEQDNKQDKEQDNKQNNDQNNEQSSEQNKEQGTESVDEMGQENLSEADGKKNDTEQGDKDSEKEDNVKPAASNNAAKDSNKKKKRYIVKKGDTLESISLSCYGTSKYIKKIKKINKLENADKIYIGQELILP